MLIHDLASQTGVPTETIRYYESIGKMPHPQRAANNYRQYTIADLERLRFIASARGLGFAPDDIREILVARDGGEAPCQRVLETLDQRIVDVDQRIASLLSLRETLTQLRHAGEALPLNDVQGEHCVCYLVKTYRASGQVIIEKEEPSDV